MSAPITILYGAINAIFSVALAANVTRVRAGAQVFLGTGEDDRLLLAQRRHGNNIEYVPLALVVLLLAEGAGGAAGVLHGLGAALTVGRVLHAIGVGPKPSPLRALGAVLTWLTIAGAAGYSLFLAYAR